MSKKLHSAELLIEGMEFLRSPIQSMPMEISQDEEAYQENVDHQRLAKALTSAVLYPIVVELILKHLWEKERKKKFPHIHHLRKLFSGLKEETKQDIKSIYNKCCDDYIDVIKKTGEVHGNQEIVLATFEEALDWNEEAMRNLKYEMTPHGKCVPTGVMWNSETLWVLPQCFPIFAIELTHWASDGTVSRRKGRKPYDLAEKRRWTWIQD